MELECKLTREQVASYNAAVELWQVRPLTTGFHIDILSINLTCT